MRLPGIALVAGLILFSSVSAAADDARALAAQAKTLVEAKNAPAAFGLLAPQEERLGGDIEFDYWLGVAAFETNRLDRAVIAFERVLVRDPLFDSARLELARTYLRMGALDLAAQEFERLLMRSPGPEGRKLIDDYLNEITRIKQRQRFAVAAFVELGGGHDTNISSSTRDFPDAILSSFGIPGVVPTGNSLRHADNFFAGNAGGDVFYRLGEERALFAAATVRWRGYREFDDYDYLLGDFIGGYRMRHAGMDYTGSLMLQRFRQDGAPVEALGTDRITNDRDAAGVNFEVRRELDPRTQIAIGLQWMAYRYPTNPGQDTRQTILSFAADRRPTDSFSYGARVFMAQDEARRPLNPFTEATASRHSWGLRLLAQGDPSPRWNWQGAVGWTRRIDDDPFARATLIATGRDDLFEGLLRCGYRITRELSVQPYVSYAHNKSNIALYSFNKTEVGLMLRWEVR